ncbi:unnamed protein product, partial [Musa banksii]
HRSHCCQFYSSSSSSCNKYREIIQCSEQLKAQTTITNKKKQ